MSSFWPIFPKTLSRCLHCFNFEGVAISSLPTGKYFLVYKSRSSNQSCESPLPLDTLSLFTTTALFVTSPLMVFMVIEVLCPFTPRLFISVSKIKVPWLQVSHRTCASRTLPELPYCVFIGTTHILIISVQYWLKHISNLDFFHHQLDLCHCLLLSFFWDGHGGLSHVFQCTTCKIFCLNKF